jgi:hypothetical protein
MFLPISGCIKSEPYIYRDVSTRGRLCSGVICLVRSIPDKLPDAEIQSSPVDDHPLLPSGDWIVLESC